MTPQQQDAGEFERFFVGAWPKVRAFALTLTRDEAAAEEIAQEALTRVYVRWRHVIQPLPFALRVTRNLATDLHRRQIREATTRSIGDSACPEATDPGLLGEVLNLSPDLRDVVILHYYLDLALADVADVIRRPLGTVKRRLHEARRRLANTLEASDEC